MATNMGIRRLVLFIFLLLPLLAKAQDWDALPKSYSVDTSNLVAVDKGAKTYGISIAHIAAALSSGVGSFNGRTGTVVPVSTDYNTYYYSISNPAKYLDSSHSLVKSVFGRIGVITAQSGDYNSDQITEGTTNIFYTLTRARAAISVPAGILSYSNTTGILTTTLAGPGLVGKPTSGTGPLQKINLGTGLSFSNDTLKANVPAAGVSTWKGRNGAVVPLANDYNTSQVPEVTNLYFTIQRSRNYLHATLPLLYDSVLGTFSEQVATNSQPGYLSAADHTAFANKENALTFSGLISRSVNAISLNINSGKLAGRWSSGLGAMQEISIGSGLNLDGTTGILTTTSTGGVSSVFGRSGAVTAQNTDYAAYYYSVSNPSNYITLTAARAGISTTGALLNYDNSTGVFSTLYTAENIVNRNVSIYLKGATSSYPSDFTVRRKTDSIDVALNGKQNTLTFTPENIANKATNMSVINNVKYVTTALLKSQIDSLHAAGIAINATPPIRIVTGGASSSTCFLVDGTGAILTDGSGTPLTYPCGGATFVLDTANNSQPGSLAAWDYKFIHQKADSTKDGFISKTDWLYFYHKANAGAGGAITTETDPYYSSYGATRATTININGVTQDLSTNRTWTIAVPSAQIQSKWHQTNASALDYIVGKPNVYIQSKIDSIFSGTSAESGYNKSQWDTAYARSLPIGSVYTRTQADGKFSKKIIGLFPTKIDTSGQLFFITDASGSFITDASGSRITEGSTETKIWVDTVTNTQAGVVTSAMKLGWDGKQDALSFSGAIKKTGNNVSFSLPGGPQAMFYKGQNEDLRAASLMYYDTTSDKLRTNYVQAISGPMTAKGDGFNIGLTGSSSYFQYTTDHASAEALYLIGYGANRMFYNIGGGADDHYMQVRSNQVRFGGTNLAGLGIDLPSGGAQVEIFPHQSGRTSLRLFSTDTTGDAFDVFKNSVVKFSIDKNGSPFLQHHTRMYFVDSLNGNQVGLSSARTLSATYNIETPATAPVDSSAWSYTTSGWKWLSVKRSSSGGTTYTQGAGINIASNTISGVVADATHQGDLAPGNQDIPSGDKSLTQNGASPVSSSDPGAGSYRWKFRSTGLNYMNSPTAYNWDIGADFNTYASVPIFNFKLNNSTVASIDQSGGLFANLSLNAPNVVTSNVVSTTGSLNLNAGQNFGLEIPYATPNKQFHLQLYSSDGNPHFDVASLGGFSSDAGISFNAYGNGNFTFNNLVSTPSVAITGIRTITASASALQSDFQILVNTSSGAVTYTLPDAFQFIGRLINVKKIDSSSNNVTIAPSGSDKIDGASSVTYSTQWTNKRLISDGTNWYLQ